MSYITGSLVELQTSYTDFLSLSVSVSELGRDFPKVVDVNNTHKGRVLIPKNLCWSKKKSTSEKDSFMRDQEEATCLQTRGSPQSLPHFVLDL